MGIPDVKMIRSPEGEHADCSKLVRAVHRELVAVHRSNYSGKIMGIVPVYYDGRQYFLIGTMSRVPQSGSILVVDPNPSKLGFTPFARLLDMKEWEEVYRDSGARLRHSTPVKDMLYDPYRAAELGSTTPVFRYCTVEGAWQGHPVDLIAVYTGSIYEEVGGYMPFAMILDQDTTHKFWLGGKRDDNAIDGEYFLADRSHRSAADHITKDDKTGLTD